MTAAALIAIGLFLFLSGIGIGIGYAVRVIGDRVSNSITEHDHEMINGQVP